MFTTPLFYNDHKTKQASKQASKQPKISKTEEIHKSWCCNLKKQAIINSDDLQILFSSREYIPLIMLSDESQ